MQSSRRATEAEVVECEQQSFRSIEDLQQAGINVSNTLNFEIFKVIDVLLTYIQRLAISRSCKKLA